MSDCLTPAQRRRLDELHQIFSDDSSTEVTP